MDAEQLKARIAELEQQHRAMSQYIEQVTRDRNGLEGRIIECRHWLEQLEQDEGPEKGEGDEG